MNRRASISGGIPVAIACLAMCALPLAAQQGKSAPGEGKLLWRNGQSLTGRLVDADGDSLRWKSSLFDEPVDLSMEVLKSVTLPAGAAITESGDPFSPNPFSLSLRDGSRLFGEIREIDDTHFTVESRRHGSLRIARESLATLQRLRGGGVLWNGPFGHRELIYGSPGSAQPSEGRRWHAGAGGSLTTVGLRQQVTLPWKLDTPVEVSFRIRSTERPEFELHLLNQGFTDVITTWNDEIVLRRGGFFIPLLTLSDEDRAVALRFFWDPQTSRGAVTTMEGKLLGRWEIVSPDPSDPPAVTLIPEDGVYQISPNTADRNPAQRSKIPPDGITWVNRGKDLTIESLLIREWNGELPAPRSAGTNPASTGVELITGEFLAGKILRQDSGAWILHSETAGSGERRIPIDDILRVQFPEGHPEASKPAPGAAHLQFSDGTTLRGELLGLTGGKLMTRTAFSSDAIPSAVEGLSEISWPGSTSPAAPLADLDKLSVGSATTLHGHWEASPGAGLRWKLVGAAASVPVAAAKVPIEITRATPADRKWAKASALFFLDDGQIAPADLVSIDRDGESISVRGDLIGVSGFQAGSIAAIQFPGPELQPEGFTDPGWQFLGGKAPGAGMPRRAEAATSITLEAGESFGHPAILAGDEIQFDLLASGYGTVRLRMFTDGMGSDPSGTRLLIAHYGNEVYSGLEEAEGNFENYKQVPVEHNKPVRIRISWNAGQIETFVNGTSGYIAKFDPEKTPRAGRGLIFEPANLWGNGARTVTLSDFTLRLAPGFTWVPPVAAKAREQALFLPRFRKDDPPAHILVAHTGDLLRGTIEAATADHISFRSGLENLTIPRDRAAAAIWLKPPAPKEEAQPLDRSRVAAGPPLPDAFGLPAAPTHWFVLRSGARLGLAVDSFGPDAVTGSSATLGRCRIPADQIHLIRTTEPARDAAGGTLANWQLVAAPEPSPEGAEGGEASPLMGKVAPKIDLPLLGGGRFDLAKEKDRVVILDFWATWCGPCVRALPEMIDAFSRLDQKRVKFVAVNQAESPEIIQAFLKGRAWPPLTVALDGDQAVGRAYGVEGIPHTVIIGPDGKVAHVSTGFRPGGAAETAELAKKLLGDTAEN